MQAIIMCAGKADRWNNYLGVRKQEIKINGEKLIDRTIRLLRENGIKDILITTHKDSKPFNVNVGQIINYWDYEIERFIPVNDKAIYLYGDVYYTVEAMRAIVREDYVFFGRTHESNMTGKNYRELFAVKCDGQKLQKYVKRVIDLYIKGKINRCIGWELYDAYNESEPTQVYETDDMTEDFDTPEDYEEYIKRI